MKKQIQAYAAQHLHDMLQDIAALVAVRSVKGDPKPGMPFGAGPADALACMETIAKRHGFSPRHHDGYMLTVNLNEHPDALGILCHLDIVHEGTGWESPPFAATVRDGKIYGRGTTDNKGPAIAALYAMRCVRDLGLPLRKNVRLMLGTDEEDGSADLKAYFQMETPPPYCFTPDAAFPVYNTEKGRFAPQYTAGFPASEQTPRILSFSGGHAMNIVPSEATACIEGFSPQALAPYLARATQSTGVTFAVQEEHGRCTLHAQGTGGHAADPQDANNALTALLQLLVALPFPPDPGQQKLKALHTLLPHGDYFGNALGVQMQDSRSGALTCNPGLLRFTPEQLHGGLDLRCPLAANEQNTAQVIAERFAAHGFTLSTTAMLPPHHVPDDLPFVQTLLHAYETYTGHKGECLSMGGGTYVHGMPNSVAFGPLLPGTDAGIHGPNEYAVISELQTCVAVFAQVIADLCG